MRVPLDLFAEVETASGARFRWDANQEAGSRPTGFTFRTKLGEGFSDGGAQLARRGDLDYPDLELVNNVVLTGADGSVAYEGRISAMPRELADTHSIGVTLTGWMAHAKDRTMTFIGVDRDMSAWGPPSTTRKANLVGTNFNATDPEQGTDVTTTSSAVVTTFSDGWVSPYKPICEAWYDAGPTNLIGAINYSWARESTTIDNTDTQWLWRIFTSTDDIVTSTSGPANLRAAGPSLLQTLTPSSAMRYAGLHMRYNATPAGAAGARYAIDWKKLAVYGNHGLTTHTGEPAEPPGILGSDAMRYIAQAYCPQLNVSGVQDSSYVIQHLAFKEQTYPFDAFLEINKFSLWHLAVWENKTLTWRPYDLTDYDWEIRTDDPGTTFSPQGPSIDDLRNGVVVIYTDLLTGKQNTLTPDAHAELRDTSVLNPWNAHGIQHWGDPITLSTPSLVGDALQMGRAQLAAINQPKAPGTITVRGYVKDASGKEHPGWKVRAGDTIGITNFPNDIPRLIHETTWDDESKTLTLAVDAPPSTLDAYTDRVANALLARGLG